MLWGKLATPTWQAAQQFLSESATQCEEPGQDQKQPLYTHHNEVALAQPYPVHKDSVPGSSLT
jgi:hypothetical protein